MIKSFGDVCCVLVSGDLVFGGDWYFCCGVFSYGSVFSIFDYVFLYIYLYINFILVFFVVKLK